ncbi:response regulator transcription factor [Labilibaculum sp.]|uniref:response regulator transcription factor n=1 Tax=Labilibaculum sp. TaxID=2060723 RepID=UPI003567194E
MNSIKEKHLCKPMLKDLLFRNLHNEDMSYLKNLNIEQLMNDDQTSVSHTLRYKQKDKSWKYFYFSLLNPKQKLTNKTQLKIGIQYDLTDILSQCTKESTTVSPCFSDDLNFQKLSNLSKREKEILKFIVTGNTDKEIAIQLGISFYTVETHRKNIINKLGVKNTASLSFLAGKYGII